MPLKTELKLSAPVDCVCDFTYNFYWQHRGEKLEPDEVIPSQVGSGYTYRDLVETLREGDDVHIRGDVGRRLASSMGVDLYYFGGKGGFIDAGSIFVEGSVGSHMGISMCAGCIYVKGSVEQPLGNVVEVASDVAGYRKFRSITEIIHQGLGGDELLEGNSFDGRRFVLADGVLRNTLGARCEKDVLIEVQGDVDLSVGILMRKGTVRVSGDAGMNTGVLLRGGTVIVEGNSGEFAATEMKKGVIVVGGKIGSHIGSQMRGGVVYARSGAKTIPPVVEEPLNSEDVRFLTKTLKIPPMLASGYRKYTVTGSSMQPMR
jgi:formylmethanofuran dehydrogenase subunit C